MRLVWLFGRSVIGISARGVDYLAVAAGVLIILMMIAVVVDVVFRYLLVRPLVGVLEGTEFGLVAICFFGAAWVLKKDRHVKVDIIYNRLNLRNQTLVKTVTCAVGAIALFVIVWFGVVVAYQQFELGYTSNTPLRWPTFPRYIVIAIGSLFLFIQFSRDAYGHLERWLSLRKQRAEWK